MTSCKRHVYKTMCENDSGDRKGKFRGVSYASSFRDGYSVPETKRKRTVSRKAKPVKKAVKSSVKTALRPSGKTFLIIKMENKPFTVDGKRYVIRWDDKSYSYRIYTATGSKYVASIREETTTMDHINRMVREARA